VLSHSYWSPQKKKERNNSVYDRVLAYVEKNLVDVLLAHHAFRTSPRSDMTILFVIIVLGQNCSEPCACCPCVVVVVALVVCSILKNLKKQETNGAQQQRPATETRRRTSLENSMPAC
jgi:hypothetical protein